MSSQDQNPDNLHHKNDHTDEEDARLKLVKIPDLTVEKEELDEFKEMEGMM